MVKHTSRSDYVYTFELQRSAGGPQDGLIHEILGCKVRSCPLPAAGSRGATDGVRLWEHADAPEWTDMIVHHHRNTTGDTSIPGICSA